ncbi:MAG: 2-C-methyl-D-erythritol 4-phosphate cytidylyltransferase [Betaproteobacteria bacterium]|nr:2-C-methyl-D-erythritol 4-phosphate cytidylyltransferase [Betaproteobacteria bacterium]
MGRCIAILPAGGTGSRFGTACPKQFTLLLGQPLLVHSIHALLQDDRIQAIHVIVSPEYETFLDCTPWHGRVTVMPCAGASRADTVRQALDRLSPTLRADDWVLVHDAARPCLSQSALSRLLDTLWNDPVGGLLAVPVADTLKLSGAEGRVRTTVDRSGLWAAQTPQMFRFGILQQALQWATTPTDESAAVEALGQAPRLVQGDPANIKVTYPEDLLYARWVLDRRIDVREGAA